MTQIRSSRDAVAEKNALLRFLRDNPSGRFPAAELCERTGVPKKYVRGHLSGESEVEIEETPRKTDYRLKSLSPSQS